MNISLKATVQMAALEKIWSEKEKKMEIVNAISLNMLPLEAETRQFILSVERVTLEDAARLLRAAPEIRNLIGHPTTDVLVRDLLTPYGVNLPPGERGRVTVSSWIDGFPILVAQYIGPRLPEGATVLPEGASIVWLLVAARGGRYHCETCANSIGEHCSSVLGRELADVS